MYCSLTVITDTHLRWTIPSGHKISDIPVTYRIKSITQCNETPDTAAPQNILWVKSGKL